jgi:hypothetical protein
VPVFRGEGEDRRPECVEIALHKAIKISLRVERSCQVRGPHFRKR